MAIDAEKKKRKKENFPKIKTKSMLGKHGRVTLWEEKFTAAYRKNGTTLEKLWGPTAKTKNQKSDRKGRHPIRKKIGGTKGGGPDPIKPKGYGDRK